MLHKTLTVDTSSSDIQVGDLLEMKLTDQTVILMDDDQITSGYKLIGISNTYWATSMNDYALKTDIEVITAGVFEVTVDSDTYQIGDALEYSASSDNGKLKSFETGNTLIGWVWDCSTSACTTLKMLVNVLDLSFGLLEVSS